MSGGYAVTLTGGNFTAGASVSFGTTAATITSLTATDITVLVPAGSGVVPVVVTQSGQTSNTLSFTYDMPTATPSATLSVTVTPTSTPLAGIVIYPNPSDGTVPPRLVVPLRSATNVKVKIFTLSFRKVWETQYSDTPPGRDVLLPLTDKWGTNLANGLYYVVVSTDVGLYKVKWLILR